MRAPMICVKRSLAIALVLVVVGAAACTTSPDIGASPPGLATASETPATATAPAATATETPAPAAAPAPTTTETPITETPTTATATICDSGAIALLAGTTGGGFNATGDVSGSIDVGVCKNADGALRFVLLGRESGEQLRLDACQKSPDVWEATTGAVTYRLVDERNSQRSVPGVLAIREVDSDVDNMTWHIETDIDRNAAHQNAFDAPMCEGSQRLCTTSVGSNETLNLRAGPGLDATVITGIPGGSCAVWESDSGEITADGWVTVVFAPGDSPRQQGFVSTEFVRAAPPQQVIDVHGVANVAFGTPWPEAIRTLTAQFGEPDQADTFDTCRNPGETQHNIWWDNLVVIAHAPVDDPATDPPVLTYAAVGPGRFSATAGLQGGSTWRDFVNVFPSAIVAQWVFAVEGRSHQFDTQSWAQQRYLSARFLGVEAISDVDETTVLGSAGAGHTWADC